MSNDVNTTPTASDNQANNNNFSQSTATNIASSSTASNLSNSSDHKSNNQQQIDQLVLIDRMIDIICSEQVILFPLVFVFFKLIYHYQLEGTK